MASFLKGFIYCFLWFSSIFGGYAFLFCPFLPIIFISNRLYRRWTDFLIGFWQMYPAALMELFYNCNVHVSGDEIKTGETSLLVMNHRTRTDWNFLWPASYHCTTGIGRLKHPIKFVLKDEIQHIPGIGWVMALTSYLFIKRNWTIDKLRLKRVAEYFAECAYKYCLLIFPEGTDLTPTTKARSDKYAEQNGLPLYDYVLHPKTTGFTYLCKKLMDENALDCFYDVTIAYCDKVPQTEMSLLTADFPHDVNIHFKRYSVQDLPTTEENLKLFLERRWQEKESALKEHYTHGVFLSGKPLVKENRSDLYVAFFVWTMLPYSATILLFTNTLFFYTVIVHTLFLLIVNCFFGGFQNFEIGLFNLKKRRGLTIFY